MLSIDPKDISTEKLQGYLQSAVAPRPIAFASTIDENGKPNLSPFSFFNMFSTNPPILIFSPARRVRDNTTKHTLENAKSTKEVVINMVNFDIVQQMSLSSTEYSKGCLHSPYFLGSTRSSTPLLRYGFTGRSRRDLPLLDTRAFFRLLGVL